MTSTSLPYVKCEYCNANSSRLFHPVWNRRRDEKIEKAVSEVFDLTPQGIIRTLDLLKPIYRETSNYGHFGREGFSWEKTDKVEAIKAKVK